VELARGTEEEKQSQLRRVAEFQERHRAEAPAALERLRRAATDGDNLFDALMAATRSCTLGLITDAFFEVGGQYRRNV
jgi:methylmalonyl-CoA mutase